MDLAEAVVDIVEQAFDQVAGPVPAVVTEYDAAAGKVACKPVISLTFGADTVEAPEISDVPVQWPGGVGGAVTCPLAAGDTVLLVPAGWDLDTWKATGDSISTTPRRFDLGDCVAVPGIERGGRTAAMTAPDGPVVYAAPGGHVYLGGSDAADFVALASLVLTELTSISAAISSLSTAMATHTHIVVNGSGVPTGDTASPSGVATDGYVPTSVSSQVVRSK